MQSSPTTPARPSLSGSAFRRSSSHFNSIPQRALSFHEQAGLLHDDAAAEILYNHPDVRIYTFSPPTDAIKNLDKTKGIDVDADYPIDAVEVLPWRSKTELLSANGSLVIDKVRGSTNFLRCRPIEQCLLRNSQCWCVDNECKFVLRTRAFRYLRIELPNDTPEDIQKVAEFKLVLNRILRFEKTPCPFVRAFSVELPEDAITPRRSGKWTRKDLLTPMAPKSEIRPPIRGQAKRTMSLRSPPSAFPSKSPNIFELDRPRTASIQTSGRFSFADRRAQSSTGFASEEDMSRSESEKLDESHDSGIGESDFDESTVPVIRIPFEQTYTTISSGEIGNSRSADIPVGHNKPRQYLEGSDGPAATDQKLHDPPSSEEVLDGEIQDRRTSPKIRAVESYDSLFPRLLRETMTEIVSPAAEGHFSLFTSELEDCGTAENTVHDTSLHDTSVSTHDFSIPRIDSVDAQSHTSEFVEAGDEDDDDHDVPRKQILSDDRSSIRSLDSFDTTEETINPSYNSDKFGPSEQLAGFQSHNRGISEVTITPTGSSLANLRHDTEDTDDRSSPSPSLDPSIALLPPTPGSFELRKRLRRFSSPSPLSAPIQSVDSTSQATIDVFAPQLIQRAVALVVVKPIQVIAFVFCIISRIVGGATPDDLFSGELFRNAWSESSVSSGVHSQVTHQPL